MDHHELWPRGPRLGPGAQRAGRLAGAPARGGHDAATRNSQLRVGTCLGTDLVPTGSAPADLIVPVAVPESATGEIAYLQLGHARNRSHIRRLTWLFLGQ
jgi:hypothetical protein